MSGPRRWPEPEPEPDDDQPVCRVCGDAHAGPCCIDPPDPD